MLVALFAGLLCVGAVGERLLDDPGVTILSFVPAFTSSATLAVLEFPFLTVVCNQYSA
jgi:hypothetical protein